MTVIVFTLAALVVVAVIMIFSLADHIDDLQHALDEEHEMNAREAAALVYDALDAFDDAHAIPLEDAVVRSRRVIAVTYALTGVHLDRVPGDQGTPDELAAHADGKPADEA